MPRPRKPRHCQGAAPGEAFKPAGRPLRELDQLVLAADELEAMRLCDLLGLTQAAAGERMGVSRATVQRTVKSARAKVTRALVEGAALILRSPAVTEDAPAGE
ncbi:MAG: DUF134 domain-containing protein [Desulfarculus sp.]|nr:DUF134 domain-containing protein [Desulfarculus sp.]